LRPASQFIFSRFFHHLNLGADVNNKFKAQQFFSMDPLVLAGCENKHRTKAPLCWPSQKGEIAVLTGAVVEPFEEKITHTSSQI
jgi:hypothetical protein